MIGLESPHVIPGPLHKLLAELSSLDIGFYIMTFSVSYTFGLGQDFPQRIATITVKT